jgi:dihydrofolate synthase/folylpolyglutamate synthase
VATNLASILQAHGLKVGLFTSPHLISFEERFRINGVPLTEAQLFEDFSEVLATYGAEAPADQRLSYFEAITLLGVKVFTRHECDVNVMEVGLGGRWDSTNALDPELSILTTIGFDHQQYLGSTLDSILREKVGICRPGKPLVLGPQEYAEVPRLVARLIEEEYGKSTLHLVESTDGNTHRETSLKAAQLWLGASFDADKAGSALAQTRWPGRFDWRSWEGRDFLLDGAHNWDAVQNLSRRLRETKCPVSSILFGAMGDKEGIHRWITCLRQQTGAPIYGVLLDNPRSLGPSDFEALGDFEAIGPLNELIPQLPAGLTLGFGSLYLVGAILEYHGVQSSSLITYQPTGNSYFNQGRMGPYL